MDTTLDLTANVIDVRDIIERVKELRQLRDERDEQCEDHGAPLDAGDIAELAELESLLSDLQGMGGDEKFGGEWYPMALISDDYFKEYAQDLAANIGAIDANATWPNTCIDWDQAAKELQYDYSSVDVGDLTYWTR